MAENLGLTEEEQRLLRQLLAKQAATDENSQPYRRHWLMHPERKCNTVIGPMPKLVKASSDKMYREMIADGWSVADKSVQQAYQDLIEIPGNVLAEEANRQRDSKAERAILEYYGKLDAEEVPEKWREKLVSLKAKKTEKTDGRKTGGGASSKNSA